MKSGREDNMEESRESSELEFDRRST